MPSTPAATYLSPPALRRSYDFQPRGARCPLHARDHAGPLVKTDRPSAYDPNVQASAPRESPTRPRTTRAVYDYRTCAADRGRDHHPNWTTSGSPITRRQTRPDLERRDRNRHHGDVTPPWPPLRTTSQRTSGLASRLRPTTPVSNHDTTGAAARRPRPSPSSRRVLLRRVRGSCCRPAGRMPRSLGGAEFGVGVLPADQADRDGRPSSGASPRHAIAISWSADGSATTDQGRVVERYGRSCLGPGWAYAPPLSGKLRPRWGMDLNDVARLVTKTVLPRLALRTVHGGTGRPDNARRLHAHPLGDVTYDANDLARCPGTPRRRADDAP